MFNTVPEIKYGIRRLCAFVGHSFDDADRHVVDDVLRVLKILDIDIESGERPACSSVSEKVKTRIQAANIFVGVMTARGESVSPWLIEEKTFALDCKKPSFLLVEKGFERKIGGLHGDTEWIPFDRSNPAEAMLSFIEQLLSHAKFGVELKVTGPGKIHLHLTQPINIDSEISAMSQRLKANPADIGSWFQISAFYHMTGRLDEAVLAVNNAVKAAPNHLDVLRQGAERFESLGQIEMAIGLRERFADLQSSSCSAFCTLGTVCQHAAHIAEGPQAKRSYLLRAEKALERAITLGEVSGCTQLGTARNKLSAVQARLAEFVPSLPEVKPQGIANLSSV